MKPPNHGRLVRVTSIADDGHPVEFEGFLALDPRPEPLMREETGLVLLDPATQMPDDMPLIVYATDRIELLP